MIKKSAFIPNIGREGGLERGVETGVEAPGAAALAELLLSGPQANRASPFIEGVAQEWPH